MNSNQQMIALNDLLREAQRLQNKREQLVSQGHLPYSIISSMSIARVVSKLKIQLEGFDSAYKLAE